MIVTFYSFKGGVGRSMALVNVGEILAQQGYSVICCDWDLEAPGLERYLVGADRTAPSYQQELDAWLGKSGLIDLLLEYKHTLSLPPESAGKSPRGKDQPVTLPSEHAQVGKLILRRPSSFAWPVDSGRSGPGSLRLLTSGCRLGDAFDRYAVAVRTFDWIEFYEKWAGDAYMEFFRRDLVGDAAGGVTGSADLLLIDSRTGVTEQGGVCTHHLADLVVLLSAANDLNVEGTNWMAEALSQERLKTLRGGRALKLLPVAARIEPISQKEELVDFRRRFRSRFRRFVPAVVGPGVEFLRTTEIPYMPFYAFRERVVAREPEDQREEKLFDAYAALASGIVRYGRETGLLRDARTQNVKGSQTTRRATEEVGGGRFKGPLVLAYPPDDCATARWLVSGIEAAGVSIWSDFAASAPTSSPASGLSPAQAAWSSAVGCLALIGRSGVGGALQAQLDEALRRQVMNEGFRIVLLVHEGTELDPLYKRFHPISVPAELPADSELFSQLVMEVSSADLTLRPVDEDSHPYPGASAYDEKHARFFFGRDLELVQALQAFGQTPAGHVRWLQVEGESGCGKSSFVQAAVLPAVRRGWLNVAAREWRIKVCQPGKDPLSNICTALGELAGFSGDELRQRLPASPVALRELLGKGQADASACLLMIDQFEEVFVTNEALGGDAVNCQVLDAALADAITASDLRFYLVTTLRSDSIPFFNRLPRLQALLKTRAAEFFLPRFKDRSREAAVAYPAKMAGITYEGGLAERILHDTAGQLQGPALLGQLLAGLWAGRSGNLLTHHVYDQLGGPKGILLAQAERHFDALSSDQLKRMRQLLLSLVSATGASVSTARAEVLAAAGGGIEAEQALQDLVRLQLVAATGETIELVNREWVTSWQKLQDWISEERDALTRRDELESAAAAWEAAGKPAGGLPLGGQRSYFERVRLRSERASRFLREAKRRRRLNAVGVALAVASAVAALIWQIDSTARQRTAASKLAAGARNLASVDPVASLKLALAADETAHTEETRAALRAGIQNFRLRSTLRDRETISQATLSPDGKTALTVAAGKVSIWDATTAQRRRSVATDGNAITSASWSNDGRKVLSMLADHSVRVWDPDSGKALVSVLCPLLSSELSSDGRHLVALTSRGQGIVWSIPDARLIFKSPRVPGRATLAILSPDGNLLALGNDKDVSLLSLLEGSIGQLRGRLDEPRAKSLAFNASSDRIALGDDAGNCIFYDLNAAPLALLASHFPGSALLASHFTGSEIKRLGFSPDGAKVWAQTVDANLWLWDLYKGLPKTLRNVLAAGFSSDGSRILTASSNGLVDVRETSTGEALFSLHVVPANILGAQFSLAGSRVATLGADGIARIWELGPPNPIEAKDDASLAERARELLQATY